MLSRKRGAGGTVPDFKLYSGVKAMEDSRVLVPMWICQWGRTEDPEINLQHQPSDTEPKRQKHVLAQTTSSANSVGRTRELFEEI